jgi:hypothetical protein
MSVARTVETGRHGCQPLLLVLETIRLSFVLSRL